MAHPLPFPPQEEVKYNSVKITKLVVKLFSHGHLQAVLKVLVRTHTLKRSSFLTFSNVLNCEITINFLVFNNINLY